MESKREHVRLARWSKTRVFVQEDRDGFPFNLHLHRELEYVHIERGLGEVYIGPEILQYGEGDVVAIDADVPHTFKSSRDVLPTRGTVLQFARESLGGIDPPPVGSNHQPNAIGAVYSADQIPKLQKYFRGALRPWREAETPVDGLRVRSALYAILSTLGECEPTAIARGESATPRNREMRGPLARALEFVSAHHDEPMTLVELAGAVEVRPESLCRLFRRHLGQTFTEHVNEVRLMHAADRLATTDHSVLDISVKAGYRNLSYFNRRFRRRFGLTPSEYRRRHR